MSKDPNDRYRRPIPEREKGILTRKTFDPIDEDDLPVVVGVDPAGEDADHSALVMVDHTAGLTFFNIQRPINLSFHDDNGNMIGEFNYDKEAKRWTFDGNMDDSAKVFAKFMYAHFESIINGDRDGILDAAITDMYGGKDEEESEPEKVWPEHTPMPGNHPDWMKVHVSGKFKD